jgi:hypothetical protein
MRGANLAGLLLTPGKLSPADKYPTIINDPMLTRPSGAAAKKVAALRLAIERKQLATARRGITLSNRINKGHGRIISVGSGLSATDLAGVARNAAPRATFQRVQRAQPLTEFKVTAHRRGVEGELSGFTVSAERVRPTAPPSAARPAKKISKPAVNFGALITGGIQQLLTRGRSAPVSFITSSPFISPIVYSSPSANPITQVLAQPQKVAPTKQSKTCECDTGKPVQRKKRAPRTTCYRGTYVETASGLSKKRLEPIPCQ